MKLLEHVCQRETLAVFHAGGLNAMLNLVTKHSANTHKVNAIEYRMENSEKYCMAKSSSSLVNAIRKE